MSNTDEKVEVKNIVETKDATVDQAIENFDKYVDAAIDDGCIKPFMECYINYRETGFDFVDAYETAATDNEIEITEDEDE